MEDNQLRKTITLPGMIAMAAGGMVAAWMVEIKYWFEIGGAGSVWSLITCAVLVLPLCFIYSEMTSMMPYAGGQNLWVSNALGWNTGFGACWLIMLLYVMAMPTVAYGIASMLGYLYPITSLQTKIIATVILVVWYFLTNSELKILAKMQNILFWSTLIVAVGGVVGNQWIDETDIVDPRVADLLGMHWLGLVIVIMGALTCITTLSSFWLSASRILLGAAKQRQMTPRFMKLNRHGQPAFGNLVVGILSIYFTVFAPDAWVNYIYTIYGVTAGLVYLLVTISFLRLRKTHPEWERPYRLKGGTFWGIFGICFCLWVVYTNAIVMDLGAWVVLIIYAVLGVAFWGYAKYRQKQDPEHWAPLVISPDTVDRGSSLEE